MANRIAGNVLIVDSSLSNLPYLNARVLAASFYGSDTTARLTITYVSSTLDSIIAFAPNVTGGGPWSANQVLGGVQVADTMRVLLLTAGTGYLYLG